MKRLSYIISALLITSVWCSCKKEGRIDYINYKAPAPAQISNVQVERTPGGAILTYKIPVDPNLSYVKAVYEIQPGVSREAKASFYTDTLHLVGFGDTLSHEIKLYTVGKNEKESEPITVSVVPMTPPVQSVFSTLTLEATFGGIQVTFQNSSQANLAIVVILDTTGLDTWAPVTTFYTGALKGSFSARGFDTKERKFAVYIQDRWNNKSDTLIKSLSPIFEQFIPKNTWQSVHLPTDTWTPASSYVLEHLWDNNINGYDGIFASSNASVLPQWFTIDLGKKVVISRIVEHQGGQTSHFYAGSALKKFELWGTNDPNPDGSWDSWQLLGAFESFKPSGLPMGKTNSEDLDYAWVRGEDFSFENLLPAVRYIRFKSLESYASSGQIVIAELDLWGQIQP